MKHLMGLAVLLMAFNTWGHNSPPSLVYLLEPTYPTDLKLLGIEGDVRVRMLVNLDGTVVDPVILYSSHPEFAGATLKAVRAWRFSPWALGAGRPEQVEVIAPLLFNADSSGKKIKPLSAIDLEASTCRQLNTDIESHMRRRVNLPLAHLGLFSKTRYQLISGLVAQRYSSEELAIALFDLSQATESIVRTCQRTISRRFVEKLPESVQLLLARAVSVKAPAESQPI
ncbi:energy transducer TonB [Pseudomonas helleri]|uniref:energy transducer TonB n=1 Tax=Pseudomonas helleri TaxID=1608996 RepID=UPI0030DD02B4